jgi:hypothetical protein
MSFSSWSSLGSNFLRGWRSTPGTIPATSQLDWPISITTISVLSWFRAVKDRLRSFDYSMGRSIGLFDSAESATPSPPAPYHLRVGRLHLASELGQFINLLAALVREFVDAYRFGDEMNPHSPDNTLISGVVAAS